MRNCSDKKILVITHQLSRTGAPIVLLDMIRVYQKQGYQIEVITMLDGELKEELIRMQIPVRVQEHFIGQAEEFYQFARTYDMVIANTLITYEVIHILNRSEVPVLWWLHEGRQYFEYFGKVLPDFRKLTPNIHVFSVGHYVQEVIEELYGVHTEILHFGVEDVPREYEKESEKSGEKIKGRLQEDEGEIKKRKSVKFLTAGTYSKVKAQDVLVEAIRRLPEEYLQRAEFFFCGNEQMYDESVFFPVKELSQEFENVTLLHQLSRKETLEWMERCDCLVVPSRIDPIPTVAVEMMMKENLCLCTDVCGVAHYIEDGVNGFTVPPEDAEALAEKIIYIIAYNDRLDDVRKAGRKIYESCFSKKVFEPRVLKLAESCIYSKRERAEEHVPGKEEKEKVLELKNATVVLTVCNQKELLFPCLEWLKEICGVQNIIIVDNGSTDGTSDLLSGLGYDYIFFDEGIQGYGIVWNAALMNFETEETIVFMEPYYLPGKECIHRLAEVLVRETCGMAGPVSNGFVYPQYIGIESGESLLNVEYTGEEPSEGLPTSSIQAGIWAFTKSVWKENGTFDEALVEPENVLLDYKLRLMQKGYQPVVCQNALVYDVFCGNYKADL